MGGALLICLSLEDVFLFHHENTKIRNHEKGKKDFVTLRFSVLVIIVFNE